MNFEDVIKRLSWDYPILSERTQNKSEGRRKSASKQNLSIKEGATGQEIQRDSRGWTRQRT